MRQLIGQSRFTKNIREWVVEKPFRHLEPYVCPKCESGIRFSYYTNGRKLQSIRVYRIKI